MAAGMAQAFEVELKQPTFHSSAQTQLPMTIINPGDRPLALQIKIYTRAFDEAGEERLTGVYPEIEALPANVIVGAESKEIVALLWTGEMPKQQIPLRIVLTQLPIDFGDAPKGPSLQVMFELIKSLYITPPNSQADIKLLSFDWDETTQTVSLLVDNQGTAALQSNRWELKIDGKTLPVYAYQDAEERLFGYTPQANLLAGERRRIPITIIADSPLSAVNKVELVNISED